MEYQYNVAHNNKIYNCWRSLAVLLCFLSLLCYVILKFFDEISLRFAQLSSNQFLVTNKKKINPFYLEEIPFIFCKNLAKEISRL